MIEVIVQTSSVLVITQPSPAVVEVYPADTIISLELKPTEIVTYIEVAPSPDYSMNIAEPVSYKVDLIEAPNQIIEIISAQPLDSIPSSKILPAVGSIPPLTLGTIESIPYAGFFSVRYFVALQSTDGKTSSFDYSITTDNNGGIFEAIFGKIAGTLSYNVLSSVISGNILFKIQNNESSILTWKVQKLSF